MNRRRYTDEEDFDDEFDDPEEEEEREHKYDPTSEDNDSDEAA